MGLSDSKYKDSFISQDELDLLLKEAETMSLSPDDEETESDTLADEAPDDPIITQDDIDALLSFGKREPAEEKKEDDLVTQDDIDALLAGRPAPKKKKDPLPDMDDAQADLDLVTPEDIRKLLMSDSPQSDDLAGVLAAEGDEDDPDAISDDDIKALISGMDDDRKKDETDGDDDETLITQDDIDALLSGVETSKAKKTEEYKPEPDEDSIDDQVSKEDIDNLLKGAGEMDEPATVMDSEGDDAHLISQDDIDKLLMGKYQEPEEETTLIDQEDIDRLLSSARPFGEDQPARKQEPDKLISQEDIDRLLQEDERDKDKTDDDYHDQVILEKLDKKKEEKPKPAKKVKEKKPLPKKKLIAAVAAVVLLAVAGAGSFFVYTLKFKNSPSHDLPVAGHDTEEKGHDVEQADMENHGETTAESLETVTVTLNDFVAVAAPGVSGSSYISLSLTFQINDTPENPIKEYEPFFRNIIYEAMNKALASQGETPVAEADLKAMIMDSLNGALSRGSVSDLEFTGFETG